MVGLCLSDLQWLRCAVEAAFHPRLSLSAAIVKLVRVSVKSHTSYHISFVVELEVAAEAAGLLFEPPAPWPTLMRRSGHLTLPHLIV